MLRGLYLAYPIDQAHLGRDFYQSVEDVRDALLAAGVGWSYDPGDAFKVSRQVEIGPEIGKVNRLALDQAELIVAFLPAGVVSVGVPMEIQMARAAGKHVAIFSDAESWSLALPVVWRSAVVSPGNIDALIKWVQMQKSPQARQPTMSVVLDGEDARLPTRSHADDAGLDLYVSEDTNIEAGTFVDVPCGLRVELPPWAWGWITGRSSALRKRGLLIHTGIIDTGYRGPIYAGAWNMTDRDVLVAKGERIAQFIVMANQIVRPVQVHDLTDSARGEGGFGSSGA